VARQFKNQPPTKFGEGQPDLILDAGNLKPSLPSTVIDLTNFNILREGEIPKSKVLKISKNL
jgi:tRNA A37 threonylcarbamoyladenosine synthetase subunit TsaC/SUA5/YrdC